MRYLLHLFSVFFLLGTFSACRTTSYIRIEVLQPASFQSPSHIQSLAVINRSLITQPDSIPGDSLFQVENSPEYLYNIASTRAVNSLAGLLNEPPAKFRVSSEHVLEVPAIDSISVKEIFHPDDLQTINQELQVDGLISLDYISIDDIVFPGSEYFLWEGQYQNYYFAVIERRITALWRLYDMYALKMIDSFLVRDSILFSSPNSSWIAQDALFAMLSDTIFVYSTYEESGHEIGAGYARHIAPAFSPVSRAYFTGNSRRSKRGGRYLAENDFQKAERIFRNYTRHENRKKAAMAFHNLAIIHEIKGDFVRAIQSVEKAKELLNSPVIEEYHTILLERIEQKKIIDRQLLPD
jgi:hypothetical protein